jgi:hypothetical protein
MTNKKKPRTAGTGTASKTTFDIRDSNPDRPPLTERITDCRVGDLSKKLTKQEAVI